MIRSTIWNYENAPAARCPILLFHGTLDSLIPVDSSERLAALFSAPRKVIPVEGAGHPDIPAFPIYYEQLDEMLR